MKKRACMVKIWLQSNITFWRFLYLLVLYQIFNTLVVKIKSFFMQILLHPWLLPLSLFSMAVLASSAMKFESPGKFFTSSMSLPGREESDFISGSNAISIPLWASREKFLYSLNILFFVFKNIKGIISALVSWVKKQVYSNFKKK